MCQPFLELLWLSTPSLCSLPLVSAAVQPFLLSQQNQLQLLSCLTILQLVAAAPFSQCPKEELDSWVHKPRIFWPEGSKPCIAWESVLQGDGRGEDASAVLTVGWHTPPAENWMRERKEVHRLESPPSLCLTNSEKSNVRIAMASPSFGPHSSRKSTAAAVMVSKVLLWYCDRESFNTEFHPWGS